MVHRPFIRKAINFVFYRFVFETEHHNGIAGGLAGELMRGTGGAAAGAAVHAWPWYPAPHLKQAVSLDSVPLPTSSHVHSCSPTLTHTHPCFARRAAGDPGVHHQWLCAAAQGGAQAVPAGGLVGLDPKSGLALLDQMLPMPVVLLVIKGKGTRSSCMLPRQAGEGGQTTGQVVGSGCQQCRRTAGCRPAAVLWSWQAHRPCSCVLLMAWP